MNLDSGVALIGVSMPRAINFRSGRCGAITELPVNSLIGAAAPAKVQCETLLVRPKLHSIGGYESLGTKVWHGLGVA